MRQVGRTTPRRQHLEVDRRGRLLTTTSTSRFGVKLVGFPKRTTLRISATMVDVDLNAANLTTWYSVLVI